MTSRKRYVFIGLFILAAIVASIMVIIRKNETTQFSIKKADLHYGTIKNSISTTGTVRPQNRLEIKPPISGRVEKVLVEEGDFVNTGQIMIWMSSADRAALIDSARTQGESQVKYWEQAYKPIPIVAPINGLVIVRDVEPGQTVSPATAILVLSDRLIVRADVDETDIGMIKVWQPSAISLEAYPDVSVNGKVCQISYESKIVNNVTTYEVDILPERVPEVFRSGMSANIKIFSKIRNNVLLLPLDAVIRDKEQTYAFVKQGTDEKLEKRMIQTGISDEQHIEIISGLNEKDTVMIKIEALPARETNTGRNPFMPTRKKQ